MNDIEWSKKAFRQLRKIAQTDRIKIVATTETLTNFPDCSNIKKLTNHTYGYRLRVGRYRILFDFKSRIKVVSIEEVIKRDDRSY